MKYYKGFIGNHGGMWTGLGNQNKIWVNNELYAIGSGSMWFVDAPTTPYVHPTDIDELRDSTKILVYTNTSSSSDPALDNPNWMYLDNLTQFGTMTHRNGNVTNVHQYLWYTHVCIGDDAGIRRLEPDLDPKYWDSNVANASFWCPFAYSYVVYVELPSNLLSVGDYAFYNANQLMNVELGESVTSIGKLAFGMTNRLYTIEIPSTIEISLCFKTFP